MKVLQVQLDDTRPRRGKVLGVLRLVLAATHGGAFMERRRITMKRCTKCGKDRPAASYYVQRDKRRGKQYEMGTCPICLHAKFRVWRQTNPEASRAQTRLFLYGISSENYNHLRAEQNDKCAICGRPETKTMRGRVISLAVDHDHETGEVRGLLCSHCNTLIGLGREDEVILRAAIEYLDRFKSGLV